MIEFKILAPNGRIWKVKEVSERFALERVQNYKANKGKYPANRYKILK